MGEIRLCRLYSLDASIARDDVGERELQLRGLRGHHQILMLEIALRGDTFIIYNATRCVEQI